MWLGCGQVVCWGGRSCAAGAVSGNAHQAAGSGSRAATPGGSSSSRKQCSRGRTCSRPLGSTTLPGQLELQDHQQRQQQQPSQQQQQQPDEQLQLRLNARAQKDKITFDALDAADWSLDGLVRRLPPAQGGLKRPICTHSNLLKCSLGSGTNGSVYQMVGSDGSMVAAKSVSEVPGAISEGAMTVMAEAVSKGRATMRGIEHVYVSAPTPAEASWWQGLPAGQDAYMAALDAALSWKQAGGTPEQQVAACNAVRLWLPGAMHQPARRRSSQCSTHRTR